MLMGFSHPQLLTSHSPGHEGWLVTTAFVLRICSNHPRPLCLGAQGTKGICMNDNIREYVTWTAVPKIQTKCLFVWSLSKASSVRFQPPKKTNRNVTVDVHNYICTVYLLMTSCTRGHIATLFEQEVFLSSSTVEHQKTQRKQNNYHSANNTVVRASCS